MSKEEHQAPVVQTLDSAIHWIEIYPVDSAIQPLNNRGQVTFHRSRVEVTASSINYQTTQIPLDLREHFVKRLRLGDTFYAFHLSVSR